MLLEKNSKVLIFVKDSIALFDILDGQQKVLQIPPLNSENAHLKTKIQNRNVVAACFSNNKDLLAVILDNKQMIVYDDSFNIRCSVMTKRVCSNITFTNDKDIVVADKTGDVYLYKLQQPEAPVLLLGHLSMLLDVVITDCGKFLISCDRDEKIRVSHFPNCYNIMSYCLGHTEFVINIKVCNKILVSAGGDGTVRMWDFIKGKQLFLLNTNDFIQDRTIIDTFCKTMDNEKVDIQALPVVDMQLYQSAKNIIILGVTLLNYNAVQTYHIEVSDVLNAQFHENLMVESKVLSFRLSSQLFILTSNILFLYKLDGRSFVKINSFCLNEIFNNCKSYEMDVDHITNVSTLYKRKYDNVQEYLEKKRLRLANNS